MTKSRRCIPPAPPGLGATGKIFCGLAAGVDDVVDLHPSLVVRSTYGDLLGAAVSCVAFLGIAPGSSRLSMAGAFCVVLLGPSPGLPILIGSGTPCGAFCMALPRFSLPSTILIGAGVFCAASCVVLLGPSPWSPNLMEPGAFCGAFCMAFPGSSLWSSILVVAGVFCVASFAAFSSPSLLWSSLLVGAGASCRSFLGAGLRSSILVGVGAVRPEGRWSLLKRRPAERRWPELVQPYGEQGLLLVLPGCLPADVPPGCSWSLLCYLLRALPQADWSVGSCGPPWQRPWCPPKVRWATGGDRRDACYPWPIASWKIDDGHGVITNHSLRLGRGHGSGAPAALSQSRSPQAW